MAAARMGTRVLARWKVELQKLAVDETGLVLHVHHYPPRHVEVE